MSETPTQVAPTQVEGGCLCGAVRYTIAWPPAFAATCSCRNCQKQAASALSVLVGVPREALRLTGELKTYNDTADSGNAVYRQFCPTCGSPVLTDTPQAQKDGMIFIKAGTLDDTSVLQPAVHFWVDSAQPWMRYPDDAVLVPKQEMPG